MTTFNVSITDEGDDGTYDSKAGTWFPFTTDPILQGSSNAYCGFRFRNVTVPQGTSITSAFLKTYFYSGWDSAGGTLSGYNADNPAVWSNSNNPSAMSVTTANVASWRPVSGSQGDAVDTDITTIVQEILNRAGFASGNAMALGCATAAAGGGYLYNYGQLSHAKAAQLTINYSVGGFFSRYYYDMGNGGI